MLKVKFANGGPIILGIDKDNIRLLQEGKPIYIKKETLNIENDIVIAYGETLQQIINDYDLPGAQKT